MQQCQRQPLWKPRPLGCRGISPLWEIHAAGGCPAWRMGAHHDGPCPPELGLRPGQVLLLLSPLSPQRKREQRWGPSWQGVSSEPWSPCPAWEAGRPPAAPRAKQRRGVCCSGSEPAGSWCPKGLWAPRGRGYGPGLGWGCSGVRGRKWFLTGPSRRWVGERLRC